MITKSLKLSLFLVIFTAKAHSIQNGHEDIHNKFKNVVKLGVLVDEGEWSICTATVLSAHTVLTAGHCVGYYLDSGSNQSLKINNRTYKIKKVIPHPEFAERFAKEKILKERITATKKQNEHSPELDQLWADFGNLARNTAHVDVALIVTERRILKKIPKTKINFEKALSGSSVFLVGFGFNHYDAEQHKYTYENGECRSYGQSTLNFEGNLYSTYDPFGNAPVTAPGDSGGALLNSKGEQIAIISHGSSIKRGTIYTPAWLVKDFLESNIHPRTHAL